MCMIKIFQGPGMVTPSNPPPTKNNFCLYPPPVFRCFWKDSSISPPPHFKHPSLLPGENKARRVNLPLCWHWWCLTFSSIFRLSSYMADINSNKNGIIIQPITLQIRAPFQFFDQSESDKAYALFWIEGWPKWPLQFLGCVCGKGVHSWTVSSSTKAVK